MQILSEKISLCSHKSLSISGNTLLHLLAWNNLYFQHQNLVIKKLSNSIQKLPKNEIIYDCMLVFLILSIFRGISGIARSLVPFEIRKFQKF